MEAYAVFAGGGVKGVAFAGCLKAAELRNIQFCGFGGTSAGSIVALLASIGYSADEIERIMIDKIDFADFFSDKGVKLRKGKELLKSISGDSATALSKVKLGIQYVILPSTISCLQILKKSLGLYDGKDLIDKVRTLVRERNGFDKLSDDFTFENLETFQAKPLKIVASDVTKRQAALYSRNNIQYGDSVLSAIRASTCYPFVFSPMGHGVDSKLVDGGLASNLPVFLFDEERMIDRRPLIAFDLVESQNAQRSSDRLLGFCGDLLATALAASDELFRRKDTGIIHIPITIPPDIDALKFELTRKEKTDLYESAFRQTTEYLSDKLPSLTVTGGSIEERRARYGTTGEFGTALRAMANDIVMATGCDKVRCYVMLPIGSNSQQVLFHHGMDDDGDSAWEMELDAGPSGHVRIRETMTILKLDDLRKNPKDYKLSTHHIKQIPKDRKALCCYPIRKLSNGNKNRGDVVGTVSVDTATTLGKSRWLSSKNVELNGVLLTWSVILSKLLQ